jgi:acyl-coenzyme A synthetase/AMP-(fatty) acid ligase
LSDDNSDNRWHESLREIEQRLYRHPAVAKVTAFYYTDDQSATSFGAAIQVHDWVNRIAASDIQEWLHKHLDADKVPQWIIWMDPIA